jgi:hypothetical protein
MKTIDLTIAEALQESAYLAGAQEGFRLGAAEDRRGLCDLVKARAGYLKPILAVRSAGAMVRVPAPDGTRWPDHDDGDEGAL